MARGRKPAAQAKRKVSKPKKLQSLISVREAIDAEENNAQEGAVEEVPFLKATVVERLTKKSHIVNANVALAPEDRKPNHYAFATLPGKPRICVLVVAIGEKGTLLESRSNARRENLKRGKSASAEIFDNGNLAHRAQENADESRPTDSTIQNSTPTKKRPSMNEVESTIPCQSTQGNFVVTPIKLRQNQNDKMTEGGLVQKTPTKGSPGKKKDSPGKKKASSGKKKDSPRKVAPEKGLHSPSKDSPRKNRGLTRISNTYGVEISTEFLNDMKSVALELAQEKQLAPIGGVQGPANPNDGELHCSTCKCKEIIWPRTHPLTSALRATICEFFGRNFVINKRYDELDTLQLNQLMAIQKYIKVFAKDAKFLFRARHIRAKVNYQKCGRNQRGAKNRKVKETSKKLANRCCKQLEYANTDAQHGKSDELDGLAPLE